MSYWPRRFKAWQKIVKLCKTCLVNSLLHVVHRENGVPVSSKCSQKRVAGLVYTSYLKAKEIK